MPWWLNPSVLGPLKFDGHGDDAKVQSAHEGFDRKAGREEILRCMAYNHLSTLAPAGAELTAEYAVKMGSATKRADIVMIRDSAVELICEVKFEADEESPRQLLSYLCAVGAPYGALADYRTFRFFKRSGQSLEACECPYGEAVQSSKRTDPSAQIVHVSLELINRAQDALLTLDGKTVEVPVQHLIKFDKVRALALFKGINLNMFNRSTWTNFFLANIQPELERQSQTQPAVGELRADEVAAFLEVVRRKQRFSKDDIPALLGRSINDRTKLLLHKVLMNSGFTVTRPRLPGGSRPRCYELQ